MRRSMGNDGLLINIVYGKLRFCLMWASHRIWVQSKQPVILSSMNRDRLSEAR